MQHKYSVEVGPETQKGEGRIRRSIHSANGLINTPHPEIATVYDIVQYAAKSFGSKRAMGYRQLIKEHIEEKEITKVVDGRQTQIRKTWSYYEYAPYEYISYIELEKRCQRLGAGLRAIGLQVGNKLEIYAGTSMFWMLMAQAANTQSMPIVTAYDTLGEEGLHHSLEESEASAIFTDAHLLPTLHRTLKGTSVRHVIFIGKPKAGDVEKLREEYESMNVITFDELEDLGERNPIAPTPPKPDDLLCIMYTSGSTGAPKGVLITHRNIVAAIAGVDKAMNHHINAEDYLIAFLPLAHIFEFMFETITLYWGGTLGYATVKTLTDANMRNCKGDLAEFRPTIMVGVPAVWENVRKGIVTKVNAGSAVIQKLFWGALAAKSFMTQYGIPGRGILDAVVFKKVKAATGGRLRYTMNGGAPLSKDTQNFLSMVMCPLLMGYGLTETCATCTVLAPEQWTLGSGGAPLACLEVKLVDVPDAGYASTNKPRPQGEIWLRGDSITSGYLNRDTENAEAFEDGWFKTGDIAQWEANGLITLIDRKKNLVKTLNGEYIALEKLESIYRTCGLATNVCVYVDQQMAKPVALVVVNEVALKKFAVEKGIAGDHQDAEDMCKDSKIVDAVLKEIIAAGRQGRLQGIELVANVVLIDEEFTPQNGMVTSAQKLNRRKIQERYQDRINAAYKNT